ncbi:hypothetical protein V1477_003039 [Vespula maculifrons]|uniref:Uncharacterized protein n=1 Tax=Vespula maculifrons TaxID=7453 RepID=A0ABD2CTQ2_VESMC
MEVALEKVDEFPVENNAVLRSFVAPGYLASRNRVESRGVSRQCLVAPRDYIGMFRLNDIHPVPSRRYLNKRRRGGGGGGGAGRGGRGRGGGRGTGSGKGLQ